MDNEAVKKKRITLLTITQVRKYIARKIREFENDPLKGKKIQEYRCAGFLAKTLLDAFEKEKIEDLERRIEIIENNALR